MNEPTIPITILAIIPSSRPNSFDASQPTSPPRIIYIITLMLYLLYVLIDPTQNTKARAQMMTMIKVFVRRARSSG